MTLEEQIRVMVDDGAVLCHRNDAISSLGWVMVDEPEKRLFFAPLGARGPATFTCSGGQKSSATRFL
jgi:hypothetical protein